jgi:hypothetical protein
VRAGLSVGPTLRPPREGRQPSGPGRAGHAALTLAQRFPSRDALPGARGRMNGPPVAGIPVITRGIKGQRSPPGAATG